MKYSKFNTTGVAALVLPFLISACTLEPAYQRPASTISLQFPAATQSNSPSRAADIPWREFCSDERLNALIDMALTNNRDFRVAALNVERSRAQYRISNAGLFPSVSGNVGYSKQNSFGVTSSQWSASVGVTAYELDLFGHVRSLNKQALEQFFATEENRNSTRIALVAEVATQYFSMREAEEQLKVAHETLSAVEKSYKLNKISFDAGASNELDLRTAEGQMKNAQINLLTHELGRTQAIYALELLIGSSLPSELPDAKSFGAHDLLATIPTGLPSELIERRPDILAAEHTLKAANANIGAARAAFFPTIALSGSVGSVSTQLSGLLGSGHSTWNFSPQMNLPIFTGGRNKANLDVAKISTKIEIESYQKTIQTALREVADAMAARSSYTDQIELQADAINAQRRRLELATLRYRQGEDSYLNVLLAQQDLQNAQQGLLQAQFNKLASEISLYKALGGGWR